MLQQGTQMSKSGEAVTMLTIDELFAKTKTPDAKVLNLIQQLRSAVALDAKSAEHLKQRLPYWVCCQFNPMCYNPTNFALIEDFCLEIPLCQTSMDDLKQIAYKNPYVVMSCLSADGQNLLFLFHLRTYCYDAGLFALFYRQFIKKFLKQYNLSASVTAFSANACKQIPFSWDPEAYRCIGARPVNMKEYVSSKQLDDLHELQRLNKERSKIEPKNKDVFSENIDMSKIQSILNARGKSRGNSQIRVRELLKELDASIDILRTTLLESGISTGDVEVIPSGRKLYLAYTGEELDLNLLFDPDGHYAISENVGSKNTPKVLNYVKSKVDEFIRQNIL